MAAAALAAAVVLSAPGAAQAQSGGDLASRFLNQSNPPVTKVGCRTVRRCYRRRVGSYRVPYRQRVCRRTAYGLQCWNQVRYRTVAQYQRFCRLRTFCSPYY